MRVGRIYRIEYNEDPDIRYVGSTFQPISKRWQDHKDGFKQYLNEKFREIAIFPYFKKYGIENFKILLIKEYDVSDKKHLLSYEQLWMNKIKCVNRQATFTIPFLQKIKQKGIMKDYYKANKEKLAKKLKKYYEENRDKIAEKSKKYREENRDKIAEIGKNYRQGNKETIKQKKAEYYENNKEKIAESKKKYYETNKEKLAEKIKCECGSEIRNGNLIRHLKSKKHQKYQESQRNF